MALSELVPNKGKYDPRVRVASYNPLNVIKVMTFYGVSTHIQFGLGEKIKYVAVGDDKAWRIVPKENNLFLKPIAEKADTNVTVITDKRTYQFALVVQKRSIKDVNSWASSNLIYSLVFSVPTGGNCKTDGRKEKRRRKNRLTKRYKPN